MRHLLYLVIILLSINTLSSCEPTISSVDSAAFRQVLINKHVYAQGVVKIPRENIEERNTLTQQLLTKRTAYNLIIEKCRPAEIQQLVNQGYFVQMHESQQWRTFYDYNILPYSTPLEPEELNAFIAKIKNPPNRLLLHRQHLNIQLFDYFS